MYRADQKPDVRFVRQPFDDLHVSTKEMWCNLARAAIEALADSVTPEMIKAAIDEYENVIVTNRLERWSCAISLALRAALSEGKGV
jgi:hypothetical protein